MMNCSARDSNDSMTFLSSWDLCEMVRAAKALMMAKVARQATKCYKNVGTLLDQGTVGLILGVRSPKVHVLNVTIPCYLVLLLLGQEDCVYRATHVCFLLISNPPIASRLDLR